MRHRIARINNQINENLFELVEIRLYEPKIAPMAQLERNFFADEPFCHFLQIGEHIAQLQDLESQGLTPGKGQELADERGRAIGVLLDLIDIPERGVRRPVIGEQQITMANDRGQDIIEVMRHAARELAYRLHLI